MELRSVEWIPRRWRSSWKSIADYFMSVSRPDEGTFEIDESRHLLHMQRLEMAELREKQNFLRDS